MIRHAFLGTFLAVAGLHAAAAQDTSVTRNNIDAAKSSVGPMTTTPTTMAPSSDERAAREVPMPVLPAKQSKTGGSIDGRQLIGRAILLV